MKVGLFGKTGVPPIKSLLSQGNEVMGNIRFVDGLRVDGVVVGDITASDSKTHSVLVISETATVTGRVEAGHVIVNGSVKGPVLATELLELQPRARVEGDVHYLVLEMHQGATITGQLKPMERSKSDAPVLKLTSTPV